MISLSKLETIDTSQVWRDDAVVAIGAIDEIVEIIKAAKRWRDAIKNRVSMESVDEYNEASRNLIALIDKVRE